MNASLTDDGYSCPKCGRTISYQIDRCPECRFLIMFDVLLEKEISDNRLSYQVARRLLELLPNGEFSKIRHGLQNTRLPSVHHMTRSMAERVHALLSENGIESRIVESDGNDPRKKTIPVNKLTILVVSILVVVGFIFALSRRGAQDAQDVSQSDGDEVAALSARELAAKAIPATVMLQCMEKVGSGFFITSTKVLTNAHVLCNDTHPPKVILHDKTELQGDVIVRNEELDVAMVEVENASGKTLEPGDASTLQRGDTIYILGNPRGMDFTFTKGMISHHERYIMGYSYLQIDGSINPGNSGGPVLDTQGRVIGIASMQINNADGLGLAIPINYLYVGEHKILSDAPRYDELKWAERIKSTTAKFEREKAELTAMMDKPLLISAVWQKTGLIIQVMIRTRFSPPNFLDFTIEREGINRCSFREVARRWIPLRGMSTKIRRKIIQDELENSYATIIFSSAKMCPDEARGYGNELIVGYGAPGKDRVSIKGGTRNRD